ncbi:MAG: hypothetical protein WCK05_11605 [Planctomycetota bacterium]
MQALEELVSQAGVAVEKARPYSTRSWGEITRMHLPPPVWFLGECFGLGLGRVRLHAVFGQGGLGKSRIGFNIVRNQVLGRPFGGMSTGNTPLRHLFMADEMLGPTLVTIHNLHFFAAFMGAIRAAIVAGDLPARSRQWLAAMAPPDEDKQD